MLRLRYAYSEELLPWEVVFEAEEDVFYAVARFALREDAAEFLERYREPAKWRKFLLEPPWQRPRPSHILPLR